jgi:hypothetical protein
MSNPIKSLAMSIKDCTDESGIGINAIYDEIRNGKLKARKIGRRTIILRADFEAYLNALPALDLSNNPHTPRCRNKQPLGRRKNAVEGVAA